MASVRRRTAATWWSGAVHVPSSAPRARRRAMVDIQGQDLTRPDGTGPQQGCVSVTIVRANPKVGGRTGLCGAADEETSAQR